MRDLLNVRRSDVVLPERREGVATINIPERGLNGKKDNVVYCYMSLGIDNFKGQFYLDSVRDQNRRMKNLSDPTHRSNNILSRLRPWIMNFILLCDRNVLRDRYDTLFKIDLFCKLSTLKYF